MDGVTGAAWPLDSLSGVCGEERPYSLLSQVFLGTKRTNSTAR